MLRSLRRVVLAGAMVGLTAAVTSAQQASTSTEVKKFEVIAVDGNDLVVTLPEGTRQINVPPGFLFMVDGKQLSVNELKPGMSGTASITTKTTVTPVTVTEVKSGTVALVSGTAVYVRTPEGVRLFTQSELDKRGVKIFVDGKPRAVSELHEGNKLTATIVTTKPPQVVTEKDVQATLAKAAAAPPAAAQPDAAPAAPAAPAAAASPAQQPVGTTARALPKTAGSLPTISLVGLASLALAAAMATRRRRVR
jgi:LPXTG-motif cell wall-anchored protein